MTTYDKRDTEHTLCDDRDNTCTTILETLEMSANGCLHGYKN